MTDARLQKLLGQCATLGRQDAERTIATVKAEIERTDPRDLEACRETLRKIYKTITGAAR